jgi:hypothetical protein
MVSQPSECVTDTCIGILEHHSLYVNLEMNTADLHYSDWLFEADGGILSPGLRTLTFDVRVDTY